MEEKRGELQPPLSRRRSPQIKTCFNLSLKGGVSPVAMARRSFHMEEIILNIRSLVCILSLQDSAFESCRGHERHTFRSVTKPELVEDSVQRVQPVVCLRYQNQSRTP